MSNLNRKNRNKNNVSKEPPMVEETTTSPNYAKGTTKEAQYLKPVVFDDVEFINFPDFKISYAGTRRASADGEDGPVYTWLDFGISGKDSDSSISATPQKISWTDGGIISPAIFQFEGKVYKLNLRLVEEGWIPDTNGGANNIHIPASPLESNELFIVPP
ncbi:MAG: hypothetical protein NTW79_00805 [Candidatus Berkelbacteria bacterium]|nr:hypothetical protein [Candidatus Berkelbacteria bacterium]